MIRKEKLYYPTLAQFLALKRGADAKNTTYRTGDIDSPIQQGEPDVMYQSWVLIKDTQQIWSHDTFLGPNSDKDPWHDLEIEVSERKAMDEVLQRLMAELQEQHATEMQQLSDKVDRHLCAIEFDDEEGDIFLITSTASAVTSATMDDDGNVLLNIDLN